MMEPHADWLNTVKKCLSKNKGKSYGAEDKHRNSIIIECTRGNPGDLEFLGAFQNLSKLVVSAYLPVEVEFAKKHPEALATDRLLAPLHPLFAGTPDLNLVQEKTKALLGNFFINAFPKMLDPKNAHIFVTARDESTNALLGMIYFVVAGEFAYGEARVPVFAVDPNAQNRGIGKLLLTFIKTLLPETNKISLSTRITNENAIRAYKSWGFTESQAIYPNWTSLTLDL